jgi:hypothetical protein
VTLDEIAETWCRYTTRPADQYADLDVDDDPDWWAIEFFMTQAVFDDALLCRAGLLKLLEHADDDHLVRCVGAGPLENFLSDNEDDLRWVEMEAGRNPRLREALAGVWIADKISEQALQRLDHAAGVQLPRPRPRSELPPEVVELEDAVDEMKRLLDDCGTEELTPEPAAATQRAWAASDAAFDAVHRLDETNPE